MIIRCLITFSALIFAAAAVPTCSEYYGRPNFAHCNQVIAGSQLEYRKDHSRPYPFVPDGWDYQNRPSYIIQQYWSRNFWRPLPEFYHNDQAPNCLMATLPVDNGDHMFNPDLAKYPDLRAIAQWINRFCVHAQGMANMQGLGGIMTAGENQHLRFIVYAPGSDMDKGAREDQKDGFVVSVAGADFSGSDSDATISDEDEPATNNPYQDLQGAANALLGLRDQGTSAAGPSGARSLPQGWELSFKDTTYMQGAESDKLQSFWKSIDELATEQFANKSPPRTKLTLKADHLQLQLASSGPISWMWLLNFAQSMLRAVRSQLMILFDADAYSTHFKLPPITTKLSII